MGVNSKRSINDGSKMEMVMSQAGGFSYGKNTERAINNTYDEKSMRAKEWFKNGKPGLKK